MDILNQIWQAVAPYLAGISVSGIISAVIYGCLKGAFNKTISKINVEKIADEATEKGIEKVKKISYEQSIQPLVESELKKIDEYAAKEFKKELEEVKDSYDKLLVVLEKLAAYFDNSIGVSEESKKELHQAIEDAKSEPTTAKSVEVEVVDSEEEKTAHKGENKAEKAETSETKETKTEETKVVR